MSGLRDVLLLVIIMGLVPVSLFRPWVGVLAWFWIAYFVPHSFTWGFGRSLPVAVLVGGATLVGFLFTNDRKGLPGGWAVVAMLLFSADVTLTSFLAFNPELAWGKWNWVIKEILMTLVALCLFQDRARLRWLYMVPAICLGLWGLKGAIWVLRTAGGNRASGPELSFWGGNNEFGLALSMALPLLLYLSREEPRPWLKRILRILFAVSIVAIIFTYSRGAFLSLVTILSILIWRSPWRLRFAAAVTVVAFVFVAIAPEELKQRVESIGAQDSAATRDNSAAGRLEAWTTSWHIATAHPFAGEGFRALWNEDIWNTYYGYHYLVVRDTHSLYFEVMSEHGLLGFALYLSMLMATLFTLAQIRKRWRDHPQHGYLSHYAEMNQLSLYPFLVAGAFLSFAYFDLFFLLVGTSTLLKVLSSEAEQTVAQAAVLSNAVATRPAPDTPSRRLVARPDAKARHA